MATNATAEFWCRTDGVDTNGGGYDPGISGAGTNYSDQAAPQASWSNLSLSAGTVTDSSATGLFTAAMIGNLIAVVGQGRYWITARTSSNVVTVVAATGTSVTSWSGASGKVGGAWLGIKNLMNGGGLPAPSLTTPIAAGNIVHVRGTGTDDPSTADYDYSAGYYQPSWNGDTTAGFITFEGYNGRPCLKVCGLLFHQTEYLRVRHLKFLYVESPTFPTHGITSGEHASWDDCYCDQNGQDVIGSHGNAIRGCRFVNSGSTSAGTRAAIDLYGNGPLAFGNHVSGWRGPGIGVSPVYSNGFTIMANTITGGGTDGILVSPTGASVVGIVEGNTINANAGHGINVTITSCIPMITIINNMITNHTGGSKAGIAVTSGASTAAVGRLQQHIWDYNNLYNNTINYSNTPVGPHDLNLNPSYAGSGDYTPTNAALQAGFP